MSSSPSPLAAVGESFTDELKGHAVKVRVLLDAPMPPGPLRRACAMELLSMVGSAAVLGVPEAKEIAGNLGEALAASDAELGARFWRDFSAWIQQLAEHLCALSSDRSAATSGSLLLKERAKLEQEVRRKSPSEATAPSLSLSAGRRVLFIDDSPTARAVVIATLSDCGYVARAAADLRETAVLLLDFEPEIVISDVQLPGIDGDQLCRRIKQTMRRLVPIVLYSSLPEAELAQRARAAGADGYVTKHYGVSELVKRVDELLSSEVLF